MSLIDPINEKELMEQAAKNLRPIVIEAIIEFREAIKQLRDDTEIEVKITFRKKES